MRYVWLAGSLWNPLNYLHYPAGTLQLHTYIFRPIAIMANSNHNMPHPFINILHQPEMCRACCCDYATDSAIYLLNHREAFSIMHSLILSTKQQATPQTLTQRCPHLQSTDRACYSQHPQTSINPSPSSPRPIVSIAPASPLRRNYSSHHNSLLIFETD